MPVVLTTHDTEEARDAPRARRASRRSTRSLEPPRLIRIEAILKQRRAQALRRKTMADVGKMDRNLALEAVRVTEAAALAPRS